jgi:hypothetical protein
MFEHRTGPLLSRQAFAVRLARSFATGMLMILICLVIGMIGYHLLEKLSWIDAFANASMILSGMGPLSPLQTNAGKLFAGCYALFSGLAFITIISIVLAPAAHRFLHQFHMDLEAKKKQAKDSDKV